jgi:hypothetical protein
MSIRTAVAEFAELGRLPDSNAPEETIAMHQVKLTRITAPVTDAEAKLLVECFGPDDCYGLAWTLLHLVESAPSGIPLTNPPSAGDNQWIRRLWDRSHRR